MDGSDMDEQKENRRRCPRAPVKVEVLCEELAEDQRRGTAILCFYSSNIILGGVFLETTVPFATGAAVQWRFSLPGLEKEMMITGKVIRIQSNPLMPTGIGIEFLHLSYEDKKAIEGYVVNEIADQL